MVIVKFVINGKCCLVEIAGSFVRLSKRKINRVLKSRFMESFTQEKKNIYVVRKMSSFPIPY